MRNILGWLDIFAELLEVGPKWHAPDWGAEHGELARVSSEHKIPMHHIKQAIKQAKIGSLPHKTWKKLHNTDSWGTNTVRKANQKAKTYGRDIGQIHKGIKKGHSMPTPIVAKMPSGEHHLVGGNTRLMASRAHGIKPKVTYLDLSNKPQR